MVGKNDKVRGFRVDLSKEGKNELCLFPLNYEIAKAQNTGTKFASNHYFFAYYIYILWNELYLFKIYILNL